jgi:chlorophyll synthase
MWAFLCGAVSSGAELGTQVGALVAGIVLTGPLVCGASQIVNDWHDRDVDRLNEPRRPLPSGRVSVAGALRFAWLWSLLALGVGAWFGWRGFLATALALLASWAYSAPPLRLKRNGWWGNLAVGVSYEGLAWLTGILVMQPDALSASHLLAAACYSIGAHGIMTLNDFKSVRGDQAMGIRTLPVQLGAQRAGLVACVLMILPQLVVVAALSGVGARVAAAVVMTLALIQVVLMRHFLVDVFGRALWYSAVGVPVFVSGMLATAIGLRP